MQDWKDVLYNSMEDKTDNLFKMEIGDRVSATITKNGYFISSYKGTITGFTINNRVKVKSYRGVKIHAQKNINKPNIKLNYDTKTKSKRLSRFF